MSWRNIDQDGGPVQQLIAVVVGNVENMRPETEGEFRYDVIRGRCRDAWNQLECSSHPAAPVRNFADRIR